MTEKDYLLTQESRLLMAIQSGDVVELDRLLHEELLFIDQRGQLITKSMDLAVHRSGHLRIDSLRVKEHDIQLHGEVAVVSCLLKLKGANQDQNFTGWFRYGRVWKREGAIWRVVAGSCVELN
jgi:ketosteroid isomerase-like protein